VRGTRGHSDASTRNQRAATNGSACDCGSRDSDGKADYGASHRHCRTAYCNCSGRDSHGGGFISAC